MSHSTHMSRSPQTPARERSLGARVLAPTEVRRIIFGLMVTMLLAALDQTIVATALPTIGRDLGDVVHLPWVVTAYLLSATSSVPIYGALSDIRGRRVTLLVSISIFLAGSLFCALAPSMTALVAARFVQGIGGGGLLALSQTIAGDILTPRERGGYQAYFATAFTVASLAGPVLGGFFAEHLDWSMIFWINMPIGVAAFLMTSAPLKRLPRPERPHKLDVVGAALLVAATSTLLLALSWPGARVGWMAPGRTTTLAASVVLFVGLFHWLRRAAKPIIPLDMLADKVVRTAIVSATLSVGLFLGLAIYTPILFESVRGLTASQSGIALMPLMIGTVAGTMMSGRAMARLTHYKRVPLAAMPFATLAALVLTAGAGTLPIWLLSLLLAIISIALGTLLPISMVSIQNVVRPHELGTATATANLCRQLGGAVMVALFGTIVLGTGANPSHEPATVGTFSIVFAIVAFGSVCAFATMALMEERPLSGANRRPTDQLLRPE